MGDFKLKVTDRKPSIRAKISDFLSRVTLKFMDDLEEMIGRFYTMLGFVHHFKAISEFKRELQSRNARFWSKSATICPVWPLTLMADLEKIYGTFSMVLHALCITS